MSKFHNNSRGLAGRSAAELPRVASGDLVRGCGRLGLETHGADVSQTTGGVMGVIGRGEDGEFSLNFQQLEMSLGISWDIYVYIYIYIYIII